MVLGCTDLGEVVIRVSIIEVLVSCSKRTELPCRWPFCIPRETPAGKLFFGLILPGDQLHRRATHFLLARVVTQ